MKKNLYDYINKLEKEEKVTKDLLEEILLNIKIYQHERLVHLIVTVFVGLVALLFLCFGILLNNIGLLLLFVISLLLFIPYIFHYYYLENGTQRLYTLYFKLKKKCR